MDPEIKVTAPVREGEPEVLKKAPTFYAIVVIKLIKGVLAIFFAVLLYFQTADKIPTEYQQMMQNHVVQRIFHYLRIQPENKFFTNLTKEIASVTDAGVREAAIGALVWALFPLTEGIGMMFRAGWAGWMAIVESAFFVPIELYRLSRDFSWFMVSVTVVNIIIVVYLFVNRNTLFHHHHFHLHKAPPASPPPEV